MQLDKTKACDDRGSRRLQHLDTLRCAAILCIVLVHLPAYTPTPGLVAAEPYLVHFGLAVFVALTGYLLERPLATRARPFAAAPFLRRRWQRIYPLYAVALAAYLLLFYHVGFYHHFGAGISASQALAHFACLQVVLGEWITPLPTLWYIGLVALHYVVHALLAGHLRRPGSRLAGWLVVAAALAVAHARWGLVDNRFFMYLLPFLLGVAAGAFGLLEQPWPRWLTALLVVTTVACMVGLWPLRATIYDTRGQFFLRSLPGEALRQTYMLAATLAAWNLAQAVRRAPTWVGRAAGRLSLASYAIYLFHRPVLAALCVGLKHVLHLPPPVLHLATGVLALPLVIVAGMFIARAEAALTARLSRAG